MLPNSPVTAQAAIARPSRNTPATAGMTYALNMVASLVGLARDTLKRSRTLRREPTMHVKQGLSILSLALTLAATAPSFAQDAAAQKSLPTELIDALNAVFGKQTDNRAVHAKGVVLEGKFTPSPEAATLSKAPHLQRTAVPVTVRFSDFAGVPTIPDADPNASPRGLAVKFHLPDGTDSDLVAHSYNGFPTATAVEFRDLLRALAASGPDAPKPTPLHKFFDTHPIAKTFLTAEKPAPVSFGT